MGEPPGPAAGDAGLPLCHSEHVKIGESFIPFWVLVLFTETRDST